MNDRGHSLTQQQAAHAAAVLVMGEAVAEAYVYEDVDGDDILGLRLLRKDYPMQHGERLYTAPTANCITQAELDAMHIQISGLQNTLKKTEQQLYKYQDDCDAKDARIRELEEYTSVSLTVGGGHVVYGSGDAIARAQMYVLLDSRHPVEAKDTARYFAGALQKAEAELDALRKDAERYRWLRGGLESSPTDAVIDAAIAEERQS